MFSDLKGGQLQRHSCSLYQGMRVALHALGRRGLSTTTQRLRTHPPECTPHSVKSNVSPKNSQPRPVRVCHRSATHPHSLFSGCSESLAWLCTQHSPLLSTPCDHPTFIYCYSSHCPPWPAHFIDDAAQRWKLSSQYKCCSDGGARLLKYASHRGECW